MKERTSQGIADALQELRRNYPDQAATRRYAEGFSWDDTTNGQLALFSRIIDSTKNKGGMPLRQRAAA
jgi:teichuronic acid biosynthesis glycosyltransferase TuaC